MPSKTTGLTASFLRSFVLLIVVPILLVLVAALSILRNTMLEEAVDRIALAQDSVASALTTEIRDAELALAHFLLVNQEQAFDLASQYNLASGKDKTTYAERLTQLFNVMLLPRSNVIALHFYMKDANYYGLKDDLAVPIDTIKSMKWYQGALASKGHTVVDVSDGPVTFIARNSAISSRLIFTAAYAPGKQYRFDQVEMVCLYFQPKAAQQIVQHTGASMGVMMLVDEEGHVLYDGSKGTVSLPEEVLESQESAFLYRDSGQTLHCFVTNVPGTAFRLVTAADQSLLLGSFNRTVWIVLSIAFLIFSLFGVFSIRFFRNILSPMNSLILGMKQARQGDLSVSVPPMGRQEMQHLLGSFNKMMRQLETLVHTVSRQQEEKRQQEVKALQAQINPHFLFNTLNSIHFIARIAKFESIGNMTDALMKILHCAFKGDSSFHTIAEELEVLKSYILLMRIRYADSFEERFEVDDAALSCLVPLFTLQPIVENSIVHGFANKDDHGHLLISVRLEGDILSLSVWDDGQGMDAATIERVLSGQAERDENRYGIGINNVQRRIFLHYGQEFGVSFESEVGEFTRATITLPAKGKEAEA